MKSIKWSLPLAFLFIFTFSSFASDNFQQDRLNEYFDVLFENHRFMGSVAILSGDEIQYHYGVGYADAEQKIEIDDHTLFRIASVSKPFTATLILQLAEEGKISLDDPLSEYHPEFPNADKISIEHLLYHRSGLYNFTNDPAYTDWMTEYKTRDELLKLLADHDPVFDPDEKMEYSNTNYILLTVIAENVSGLKFGELLKQNISGPLGLEHTYLGDGAVIELPEAHSYDFQKSWHQAPVTDMSIPLGAGGIVSTPVEVVRFAQALFNGELLSDHSLDAMTNLKDNVGMGLFHYPYNDQQGYGHTGGIDSFRSNLAIYPEEDLYIAITANSMAYSNNDILVTLLDAWHGKDVTIPDFTSVTLSEEHLRQFTGEYSSEDLPIDISVWVEDGNLMAQATGQGTIPLDAESETRFRFDQAGLVMDFAEGDPAPTSFVLFQAGQEFIFQRKAE